MNERPPVIINIFYGGKIGRGSREGMTYTVDEPTFTFFGNERTTLHSVRNQIMANFGITEVAHTLGLKARWNVGTTEPYFEPIVVDSEESWQNILQTTIGSRLQLIHLYVTIKPIRAHQTPTPNFFQNYQNYQYEMQERNEEDAEHEEVGEEEDDYDFEADDGDDGDAYEPFDGRHLSEREGINTGESNYERDIRGDRSEDDEIEHLCVGLGDITGMSWTQDDYFGGLRGVKSGIDPGALYKSKADLKTAIREYHIDKMAEVYVVNSNQSFIQWKCKHNSCKWALYATNQGGQWMVRTQTGTHICTVANPREDHRQLTSTLVAEAIRPHLKRKFTMEMSEVETIIRAKYPKIAKPGYWKMWKGREDAIAEIFGGWEEAYALLPRLLKAIQDRNPGTVWAITHTDFAEDPCKKYFKSAAWAFGPCIQAWKWCRPVFSIDATFLSGRYGGRLLTATAFDGNNQPMPLAFGIVEKENNDCWGWWLHWLRRNVVGEGQFCLISDRHKSIKYVVKSEHLGWSEARGECVHRYCTQHVGENVYKVSGKNKEVKKWFKLAVKRNKPRKHKEYLDLIKVLHLPAWKYIKKIGSEFDWPNDRPKPYKWSQSNDLGWRWGQMTSNGSESLNAVFKDARMMPVTCVVRATFSKCVDWFNDRRKAARDWQKEGYVWCKRVTELLQKRQDKIPRQTMQSYDSMLGVYSVCTQGEKIGPSQFLDFTYTVNLPQELGAIPQCDCRKPQNHFVPCVHVLTVCQYMSLSLDIFVSEFYSVGYLRNVWAPRFNPYANQDEWAQLVGPILIPNPEGVLRGRRKHVRGRMDMDHMENREGPGSASGSGDSIRGRRRTRGRGSRQPNRAPTQAAIRRAIGRPSPQQHQPWMSQQSWGFGSESSTGWGRHNPNQVSSNTATQGGDSTQPRYGDIGASSSNRF